VHNNSESIAGCQKRRNFAPSKGTKNLATQDNTLTKVGARKQDNTLKK
jgi:hypothetical protein